MYLLLIGLLTIALVPRSVAAQPADCAVAPQPGSTLPLSLDLGGRPGVPPGLTGQVFVTVPMSPPGIACPGAPPVRDILRGEPGNVLGGPPSRDLLRGPGVPSVRVETR
jgi:hypothetical protein